MIFLSALALSSSQSTAQVLHSFLGTPVPGGHSSTQELHSCKSQGL